MAKENRAGACRGCGVELVDWDRVRRRNSRDEKYTFEALKHEMIRHHFWHKEIDEKAVRHGRKKGRKGLAEAVAHRIRKYVSPAENKYDGRQTPMQGNSVYYAQHATASCCRKCMNYWHDIPFGRVLTEGEIAYFTRLAMRFLDERMPYLTEDGEKIPSRRTRRRRGLL